MRVNPHLLFSLLFLTACAQKNATPDDPFEPLNRKIFAVNYALDKAIARPVARTYRNVIPGKVRLGVTNFFNNIRTLPTIANDLLQGQPKQAYRDSWRFFINSTIGIGGLFDAAEHMGLEPHLTDMGITFGKWGNPHSPYVVIPLMPPSTIRDVIGTTIDYTVFTPYPYLINDNGILYGILALQALDLRTQYLDADALIDDAIDPYVFVRDAYLQSRAFQIEGKKASDPAPTSDENYIEESADDAAVNAAVN